jgi:pimeloyl-ACP methyl ester carboxylesterase
MSKLSILLLIQGYSYVIFANNDVLVPHGAIESIRNDLQNEVLVVPLTTMKGAGHNPGQVSEATKSNR